MAFGRELEDHRVPKLKTYLKIRDKEIITDVCIMLHNFPLLSRKYHFSIEFSSRVECGNREPI